MQLLKHSCGRTQPLVAWASALWLPHTRSCKAVRPINSFEPSNQVPSPHWVPGNRSFAKIVVWQPNSTLNDAKALPGIPWWRAPEGMYGIPYTNIYQCFHLDPDKYLPSGAYVTAPLHKNFTQLFDILGCQGWEMPKKLWERHAHLTLDASYFHFSDNWH